MLKYFIAVTGLLGCMSAYAAEARLPGALSSDVQAVDGAIAAGVLGLYRVEVMAIDERTMMDPPPERSEFRSAADVVVIIGFTYGLDYTRSVLSRIKNTKWERTSVVGFARWRFRIVGPWDRGHLDMLIDRAGSLVEIDGIWYRVDRQTVDLLTSGAVDVASRSFLPKPDERVNP